MVGATNNVRDLEIDVIGYHAEVIRGAAVGAQQNEVLDFGVGELDFAENSVIE